MQNQSSTIPYALTTWWWMRQFSTILQHFGELLLDNRELNPALPKLLLQGTDKIILWEQFRSWFALNNSGHVHVVYNKHQSQGKDQLLKCLEKLPHGKCFAELLYRQTIWNLFGLCLPRDCHWLVLTESVRIWALDLDILTTGEDLILYW